MGKGLKRAVAAAKATRKRIRITRYRVDHWLNKESNETLYGVSVRIEGMKGWVRVALDHKAVIRDTRAEIDAYIEQMKSERDALGYRVKPARGETEEVL